MSGRWQESAAVLAAGVRGGRLDPVEVLEEHLSQVRLWEPAVHALLAVDEQGARAVAEGCRDGPLAGVPVVVKDNICTRGLTTTCGSRLLEGYVPPYDATVVARLRQAGAVVLAKSNLDEFAMGSSTENSAYGPTRNPYDLERVPGGSSGGSAAAVAVGMSPVALGSDTGGSVRQPACFTGLVGLKPTYGRLSRRGLVAFASSLDQIGILARSVGDCALVLGALAAHDRGDMTSWPEAAFDAAGLDLSPAAGRGLRVAVPRNILGDGVDPEVTGALGRGEEQLARAGVRVGETRLAPPAAALAAYYVLAAAEASSNLARFDGVRYGRRAGDAHDLLSLYTRTRGRGLGPEVRRRILLGTFALSEGYREAYYLKALRARECLRADLCAALEGTDALLLPTSPTPPFRLGERTCDPLRMYLSDLFTTGANLTGVPALNLPGGFTSDGLPLGVQLIARAGREDVLLRLGAALEGVQGGERRWPSPPAAGEAPAGGRE